MRESYAGLLGQNRQRVTSQHACLSYPHLRGELRHTDAGKAVRLSGWVHRKRDHGGLLFIDLRDNHGLTQIVIAPSSSAFGAAERVRAESVVRIDGKVVERTTDTVNANLPTGRIEVQVNAIEVLGATEELPLQVFGELIIPRSFV